jgi:hypothetical protein
MTKAQKGKKMRKKALDTFSSKRPVGRPGIRASEVFGRASNFRFSLGQVWDRLRKPLLKCRTEPEITAVFEQCASPYSNYYVPASKLILSVIRDPDFPKRLSHSATFWLIRLVP